MRLHVALAIFDSIAASVLDDERALERALVAAVDAGGFTLLKTSVVRFEPHGVTACAVVGESHLALHSWPEHGRLFFDVASCGAPEGVTRAVLALGAALEGARLAVLDERVVDPSGARAGPFVARDDHASTPATTGEAAAIAFPAIGPSR